RACCLARLADQAMGDAGDGLAYRVGDVAGFRHERISGDVGTLAERVAQAFDAAVQLAADLGQAVGDQRRELRLPGTERLGDLARTIDRGRVDLPRAVVEGIGDAVSIGFQRLRHVVDFRADA